MLYFRKIIFPMKSKDSSKWHQVWNSKTINENEKITLEKLIKLDGFDTGVGSYSSEEWLIMIEDFINLFDLKNGQNVYDIGCGAGAFLYSIKNKVNINCFGIDYSSSLIDVAKKNLDGFFEVCEANNPPSFGKKFELIFSHSVFQYFPSEKYAFDVIRKSYELIIKGGKLCLLDVNDKEYETESRLMRRKSFNNDADYEKFYSGLDHLFISKERLKNYLLSIGFKNVRFFKHAIEGDKVRKYRFNLMAQK